MVLYLIYLSSLIVLPLYSVAKVNVACRFIILIEQVRILMKSHAFVRSNIARALRHSKNVDSDKSKTIFELIFKSNN